MEVKRKQLEELEKFYGTTKRKIIEGDYDGVLFEGILRDTVTVFAGRAVLAKGKKQRAKQP